MKTILSMFAAFVFVGVASAQFCPNGMCPTQTTRTRQVTRTRYVPTVSYVAAPMPVAKPEAKPAQPLPKANAPTVVYVAAPKPVLFPLFHSLACFVDNVQPVRTVVKATVAVATLPVSFVVEHRPVRTVLGLPLRLARRVLCP